MSRTKIKWLFLIGKSHFILHLNGLFKFQRII